MRHESDFGTFNRSAFVTDKNPPTLPEMAESGGHSASASISTAGVAGYGAAGSVATPPSQALAASNAAAAAAVLQERPKYVYGQDPNAAADSQNEDDVASEAHGGAYSSQPQPQTGYDAEAYGSYAQYAEGGQAEAAYQEAQREYQAQQGYDAQHGYYDQNAYAAYGQQQQQGGFYDQNAYAQGYDQQAYAQQGYDQTQYDYSQQHPQQQEAYQQQHPYASGPNSTAY